MEDSKIYLFQRLEKINGKKVKYKSNVSFISENLGEYISINNIQNLYNNIPYCFEGKIIEMNNKKLIIVIPKINKIFISLDLKELHFNLNENKFIRVNSAKYCLREGNIITLLETELFNRN